MPKINKYKEETVLSLICSFIELLTKYDELDKLNFLSYNSLWVGNNDIDIMPYEGEVLIKRNEKNKEFSYFKAIYTIPLVSHCKFKITIKNISERIRRLSFGIANKEAYDGLNKEFKLFNGGCYMFYNGHDKHNLEGIIPTNDYTSPLGYDQGKEYFLEFLPDNEVLIYNKERSVNLKKSVKGKEGPFYIFVDLQKFPASCTIERLF